MKLSARQVALPSLLALLGCLGGGCHTPPSAPPSAPAGSEHPLATAKVAAFPQDDLGRAITLQGAARRVVVIGPGATESLFAIGAGETIVGRDSASTYPTRVTKTAVAGDYQGPNVEQVVALHPDLVVVQGETYNAARADDWQTKIGAPVAILAATTLKGVAGGIVKLGAWTGRLPAAQAVAKSFTFPPLTKSGTGSPSQSSAFLELSRVPLSTAGQGTLINDVLQGADYTNAARGVKGYANYSRESLLAAPPNVYIVTYEGEATDALKAASALGKLQSDPVLGKLPCVRQDNMVFVPANWMLRPGPRLVAGLMMLRAFHEKHLSPNPTQ